VSWSEARSTASLRRRGSAAAPPWCFKASRALAGEGEVAQRPAPHPFVEADRVDLVGVVAHRKQRADEGAHADPEMRSMVTPEAVSSSGTPMWANARARPPESTIPVEVPDNRRPIRAMSVLNSVSRIRSACQQNQLVPGLGPVQRRPVHGAG
jgi:hypothetical protein